MIRDLLKLIWTQFMQRKLRSTLTIIGIMIGICALVSLIMLSTALKEGVTAGLSSFGSDSILLAPLAGLSGAGGPSGIGLLSTDDVVVIKGVPQVAKVNELVTLSRPIEYDRQTKHLTVNGVKPDAGYSAYINQPLLSGRYITESDVNSVNIGYSIAKTVFDKEIPVNGFIRINSTRYRVVGIFVKEGDLTKDNVIYVNINDLRKTLGDPKAVSALDIRVTPGADISLVNDRIVSALKRSRGKKDFATVTPEQLRAQIDSFLGVVDIVVISIACISLVVGALGIMNSLYTSVLQRTKEIGTMKAVGATNGQILFIFLVESAILGFVGGVIGVLVGMGLAYAFVIPLNFLGFIKFMLVPDPNLLIGAIIFSLVLGMLAGFFPALRAAHLRPVDALRYE